jgi:sporulation protein YlmC with PRC-barrel domain
MRLSELVGREVVDVAGARVGRVADLVLVQDGAMRGPYTASLRGVALIVIERRNTRLLGYERDMRPVVFRWLVRRLSGRALRIPWEQVASYDGDPVTLTVAANALQDHVSGAGRR